MRGPGGGSNPAAARGRAAHLVLARGPRHARWGRGPGIRRHGGASLSGSGTHLRSWESCPVPAFLCHKPACPCGVSVSVNPGADLPSLGSACSPLKLAEADPAVGWATAGWCCQCPSRVPGPPGPLLSSSVPILPSRPGPGAGLVRGPEHTHARTICLQPSETALQAGAPLRGWGAGDCLVCDLIKGSSRTHRRRWAGPLVTVTGPGVSHTLWSSAQESGPVPLIVNASESGAGTCGRGSPRGLPLAGPPRRRRCLSRPPEPRLRFPLLHGFARKQIEPNVLPQPVPRSPALPPVLRDARPADAEGPRLPGALQLGDGRAVLLRSRPLCSASPHRCQEGPRRQQQPACRWPRVGQPAPEGAHVVRHGVQDHHHRHPQARRPQPVLTGERAAARPAGASPHPPPGSEALGRGCGAVPCAPPSPGLSLPPRPHCQRHPLAPRTSGHPLGHRSPEGPAGSTACATPWGF